MSKIKIDLTLKKVKYSLYHPSMVKIRVLLKNVAKQQVIHLYVPFGKLFYLAVTYATMAQMAHFSFPYYFTIPNSELRILNSDFQIPNFALRISEFGIVKYM